MSEECIPFREPSAEEKSLLRRLAHLANDLTLDDDWLDRVRVRSMQDGGMGSLELQMDFAREARVFGRQVAEWRFLDIDGVDVICSLNVDDKDVPLELDIWKTDFSPLKSMPGPSSDGYDAVASNARR